MRIAVWYNLKSGGAKRALHDHIVGLIARGHEIEVWRPPLAQQEYLDFSRLAQEHEVPVDAEPPPPKLYPARIRASMTRADRRADAMERHARQCAAEIQKGGFDLLFANTDFEFHAPHLGRFVNLPRVLYLQEPNRPLFEAAPSHRWVLPPLGTKPSRREEFRRLIENRNAARLAAEEIENASHYDRILVNSRFSRESVRRAYGLNSHVCYLGVDAGNFENRRLPRERFVMSVGSFTEPKNPRLLIEGVARIPAEHRPRLVWVYNLEDPEYRAEMERLAKSSGVDLDLRTLIPDGELVDLLNRAAAFVYAPRLEPFGLAPLEANACGAPVVAVAEGGVRETVADGVNGLLVEHDPEDVATGIMTLLNNRELANRLGEAGERLVREKWSLSAAAERLEGQLEKVLEVRRT